VHLTGEGIDVAMNVEQDRSAQIESDGQRRITMMPALSEFELLAEEISILGPDAIYEMVVAYLPRLLKAAA
jgi:hypothetical protein